MGKAVNGRSNVQWVVALFLTALVTFNLRIMYQDSGHGSSDPDAYLLNDDCSKPIIISLRGNINETSKIDLTFGTEHLHRPVLNTSHASVIGYQRPNASFLSIGVPSIKRINGDVYVIKTVQSLIDQSTAREKLQTVVIVFLADFDETYNREVAKKLETLFLQYIQMGFLQIAQVAKDYYPKFDTLKQNFRDSLSRVQWRAKQVADFAFLFMYAQNQSRYYLQLEDDVRCAPGYIRDIKHFIALQEKRMSAWAILEFSELGFIGKLFRNADLPKLSQFMLTFYEEQPVDWLISYYRMVMTQREIILRKPTLFQHVGKKSSYDTSRDNNLQDRFFIGSGKKWKTDDPPATVLSTMKHHENSFVQLVYASGSGMFWAKNPQVGDSVSVVFDSSHILKQIVVETGNERNPVDILHAGTVEISSTLIKLDTKNGRAVCGNPKVVGQLENGKCNILNVTDVFPGSVKCIIVTVTSNQENWIAFDQIGVFVQDEVMP